MRAILPALLFVSALAGCSDKPGADSGQMMLTPASTAFKNSDVTGLDYARDFALNDQDGKPRTLADFKGKAVVLFFGYTHCPDVCPTTMAEMATVMKQLGQDAGRVQVVFVTLDPERDTPALLKQYVPGFDPRFIGLSGTQEATAKVAKEFRVFYQKVPGKEAGSYTLDHTSASYVFDPQGRVRLFVRHGRGAEPIVHDLKILLAGK